MNDAEKLIEAQKSPQVRAADQMRERPNLMTLIDINEYLDRTETTLKELQELFKPFDRKAINRDFRESGIVPKSMESPSTRNEAKRLHDRLLAHQRAIRAQIANPVAVVVAPNSPPGSGTGLQNGPAKTTAPKI